jgi:hypothetical protein
VLANAIVVVLWGVGVRLCGNGVVLFDIVVEIRSVGEVAIWAVWLVSGIVVEIGLTGNMVVEGSFDVVIIVEG